MSQERQASFGPNAWLVDEMYEQYRADPSSVTESWRDFFADYRTDVAPVANEVSLVRIPASAQPSVRYSMCVLTSSSNPAAARAFQARVLGPVGRGNLSGALFGLPPNQT